MINLMLKCVTPRRPRGDNWSYLGNLVLLPLSINDTLIRSLMKFTVGSQQLSSRLSIISRVIPSSGKTGGTSAIINDILFEIKGGIIRMTGTDGETRLTLSLRTQSHEGEDYTICIRPEHLLLPLKELPAQDLTFDIDTDNQHINVRYNNGHFDFVGQDATNYPEVEALDDQSTVLDLPTSVFSRGRVSSTDTA